MENNSEVLSGLVLRRIRDGRCRYDPQVKQELVKRCLQPGVSVAALAMQHGVNANLLRKWITKWQSRNAMQQAVSETAPQNASAFLALPVNMATPHAAVTTMARKASPASANSATQPMHLRVQLPNGVAVDFGAPPMQDLSSDHANAVQLAMFSINATRMVYLHRDAIDFRKNINGLSSLVEHALGMNAFANAVFVFGNRRHDRIKILGWDRNGFWLLQKRLEDARFIWPRKVSTVVELSVQQLQWLLAGIDLEAMRGHTAVVYQKAA